MLFCKHITTDIGNINILSSILQNCPHKGTDHPVDSMRKMAQNNVVVASMASQCVAWITLSYNSQIDHYKVSVKKYYSI